MPAGDRLDYPLPDVLERCFPKSGMEACEHGVMTPLPDVHGDRWPSRSLPMPTVDFCPCC